MTALFHARQGGKALVTHSGITGFYTALDWSVADLKLTPPGEIARRLIDRLTYSRKLDPFPGQLKPEGLLQPLKHGQAE